MIKIVLEIISLYILKCSRTLPDLCTVSEFSAIFDLSGSFFAFSQLSTIEVSNFSPREPPSCYVEKLSVFRTFLCFFVFLFVFFFVFFVFIVFIFF